MPAVSRAAEVPAGESAGRHRSSHSDLFRILLGLDADTPVFATPSFGEWLPPHVQPEWPPRAGGLWLVDTRDRNAPEPDWSDSRFDAALVLSGTGLPGSAMRRLLRRLRRRHSPRLHPQLVAPRLRASGVTQVWLGFPDGSDVPTEFNLSNEGTGTAFLLTQREPFDAPWRRLVEARLGGERVAVCSFELRDRGALTLRLQQGRRELMGRLVAPGPMQAVVLRNHTSLVALRTALAREQSLVDVMPEPLFAEDCDGVAVLVETFLAGELAWRVARRGRQEEIRERVLRVLARLRAGTAGEREGEAAITALLSPDLETVRSAEFAQPAVRQRIEAELARTAQVLAPLRLSVYASHGDFGYGNILLDPESCEITGVIDWDTSRAADLPGIDRVNLEIQLQRNVGVRFSDAVSCTWREQRAQEALEAGAGSEVVRALFGAAVCRYITRAMSYPILYRHEEPQFAKALAWLEHRA